MRRAVVFAVVGLAAACSNSSSDDNLNPQPLPPQDERSPAAGGSTSSGGSSGGSSLGSCTGTCCSKPAELSACDETTDTTCSWAVTCPSGLVLSYEIECTNGTWLLTNGCPAEGQTDSRGCPPSQPADGSACDRNTVTQSCGYVLECNGYRKSMLATCTVQSSSSSTWSSPPLGKCD